MGSHPNVIQFLGLYKGMLCNFMFNDYFSKNHDLLFNFSDESESYGMVFEFAEGGTLHKHLSCHFDSLTWKDKYKLGLDITNGLKHLHDLGIVHKDLVMLICFSFLSFACCKLLSHISCTFSIYISLL